MALITEHFRELTRFDGREAPGRFWPWVATVVGASFAVWIVVFAVVLLGPVLSGGAPRFGTALFAMAGIATLTVVLLAAAVTRRLHDTGRRGWWAVPTPILLLVSFYIMSHLFHDFDGVALASIDDDSSRWFDAMMVVNPTYLASLALLITFCALPGKAGENRYGPPDQAGGSR